MVFFGKKKEITEKKFQAEIRSLEIEVARARKKNELLRIKAELDRENKQNSSFGRFFKTLGELGGNVNANLDREYQARGSGINFDHKGLTDGLPGVSRGSRFDEESVTKGLPGMASKTSGRSGNKK